jgi:hypothetical protein
MSNIRAAQAANRKKAGKHDTQAIYCHIPRAQHERIARHIRAHGGTLRGIVEEALGEFFSRLDAANKQDGEAA